MPLPTTWSTGTASVTNGETTITFADALLGTAASPNLMPGDLFCDPAQPAIPPQRLASINYEAGTAELWAAWPGTTMAAAAYEVRYIGIMERSTAQSRRLLEQLSVVQANGRGLFFRFSTTDDDADPGAGVLRLNHATIASATAAYIDNLDANGATVAGELDTWDDSSSVTKGRLWLRSISNAAAFHAFSVSGAVIDGTGYRKLTLAHVGGSGSFADGEELMAFFAPNGDQGSGYEFAAQVEGMAGLAAHVAEETGFRVWVEDLGGDNAGRGGVVRLTEADEWEIAAIFTGPRGYFGWSPRYAIVNDGDRRVLQLAGYVGGEGTAPTANVGEYVGAAGYTATIGDAVDVRGPQGIQGEQGIQGIQGVQGDKGWAPAFAVVADGARRVLQLTGYVGGAGTVPTANVGEYIAAGGYTATIGDAIDIRGETGAPGLDGSGSGVFVRVRVVDTAGGDVATGYEAGDSLDGVLLDENDLVLRATPGGDAADGVYVVSAAGAAARDASFDTYNKHPGAFVSVMEGTVGADTLWQCTSDQGGTLDTTSIAFTQFVTDTSGIEADVLDLQFEVMGLQMGQSEMLEDLLIYPRALYDSFETDDGIDDAESSNYVWDEANGWVSPSAPVAVDQTATHTSATQDGNVVSASSTLSTFKPWEAFDKITGGSTGVGCWITVAGAFVGSWLQYQFAAAKTIGSYSIRSALGYSTRAPAGWTLYGTATGAFAGEEVALDTQSSQTAWAAGGEKRIFSIGDPVADLVYFRLVFTTNNGDAQYIQIDEVELLDPTSPDDMVATSAAVISPANVGEAIGRFMVDYDGALTPGTDFKWKLTSNDGAAYLEGAYELVSEVGTKKYYHVTGIDLSAQADDTVREQFETFGLDIKFLGYGARWSDAA